MTSQRIVRRVPRPRDLRVGSLPAELAVFPLSGALLLPRGRLPLNIFEPRYLAMIEDALAGDRLIGMIQPSEVVQEDDGTEAAPDAPTDETPPPALFAVGCVGRLVSFTEREDGTCSIALAGLARFRVRREGREVRGYRRLSVAYDDYLHDLDEPGEIAFDREALIDTLRRFFSHRGFEARWDAIEQMDDETLLTTLGMICPFPPAEKQALLEAPTLSERAHTLQTLLEMAGHETDTGGSRFQAV